MKKLGFIIANEIEEFLHDYIDTDEYTRVAWTIDIHLAKVFKTSDEANRVARLVRTPFKKWVCQFSETKSQFVVTVKGDDVPPWIEKHH